MRILHLLDTLDAGGAERVAVNIVNLLPRSNCKPFLVTTRRDGPLAEAVAPDVTRLCLGRTHRFDISALRRFQDLLGSHNIDVVHAHGPSLFFARTATLFHHSPALIWHAHFGKRASEDHFAPHYRIALGQVSAVVTVNQQLAGWVCHRLKVPPHKVICLPNPVSLRYSYGESPKLPGLPGSRVVCVANLRPEKDHATVLQAMTRIVSLCPSAHLILIGSAACEAIERQIRAFVIEHRLSSHVTWLGPRDDVDAILPACDIGVLSSTSEGSPMALVEYGLAGLPTVVTRVGRCPEIVDEGSAGLLVPPGDPDAFAAALLRLLTEPELRATLGSRLRRRAETLYRDAAIQQFHSLYQSLLPERVRCAFGV